MFDETDIDGGTREQPAFQHSDDFRNLTQDSILTFPRCLLAPESGEAQTLERGASRSSTHVRHNDQFKNRNIGDFNSIFLDLA